MLRRVLGVILILSFLIPSVSAQVDTEEKPCGFVCRVIERIKILLNPVAEESELTETPADDNTADATETNNIVEDDPDLSEIGELEIQPIETKEEAIERQVKVTSESMVDYVLSQSEVSDPKCKISSDSTASPEEMIEVAFEFDEDLKWETVYLACDQYERHGLSGDTLYKENVPSSLALSFDCDYGRVTTPTVYMLSASDGDSIDYCAKPITILPTGADEGSCHTEETIAQMKKECESKGVKAYSLPDENNCETIYCGGGETTLCPSEGLVEKAEAECMEQGENYLPNRYSVEYEGQDWPCAQVRCSLCPSAEELETERQLCTSKGDGWSARDEIDFETTGCTYIACDSPDIGADVIDVPPE